MTQTALSVRLVDERLRRHQCVRCGTPHRQYRPGARTRCLACRWRYRPDRVARELQILQLFCLEISALRTARELRMSPLPIWQRFMAYRRWMATMAETEARPLTGELECDESYFGGRRRGGRRGRARGPKVIVFGILERQGRVSTVVVPQADAATLMREIERRALKGAVFYTDRFSSYKSLRRYGKHLPVDHGQTYVQRGRHYLRHINGIEGFWSYAKERLRKYHGVSRLHFPLYLKEMEFRFNHRRDDLFELLGTHLLKVLFEYPIGYST
ncbi:IS1595 family transposase [Candidatus Nitrospira bockiana]